MNTRFQDAHDLTEPVPETVLGTLGWAVREIWRWARERYEDWTRPPARILPFRPRAFGRSGRRLRHLR